MVFGLYLHSVAGGPKNDKAGAASAQTGLAAQAAMLGVLEALLTSGAGLVPAAERSQVGGLHHVVKNKNKNAPAALLLRVELACLLPGTSALVSRCMFDPVQHPLPAVLWFLPLASCRFSMPTNCTIQSTARGGRHDRVNKLTICCAG